MTYVQTFCNFFYFSFWIMDCNKAFKECFYFTQYKFSILPALGNHMSYLIPYFI